MQEESTFISQGVIERLESGSFVPTRQAQPVTPGNDRRNVISPLAVTKRCIRYEPHVFEHRKEAVLRMARSLNEPAKKILLVGGPQGCGKTSLVRGVIELMGSRNEQLLWFSVTRHTDFEEIIQFLIQYITYVCTTADDAAQSVPPESDPRKSRTAASPGAPGDEPIRKLEALINRVGHMPLLLVLDNVEYIVDPELRFNSYPFKEMLNFLLDFPNIKMVLIGERLPHADMSPSQAGVEDIRLSGLTESDTMAFMQSRQKSRAEQGDPAILELAAAPEAETEALRRLYFKTQGYPWLLKLLFYLNHHAGLDFYALNRMLEAEAADPDPRSGSPALPLVPLIRFINDRLSDAQRQVLQTLCFLRHPVNARGLQALMGVCYPVLGAIRPDSAEMEALLEHSLLKPLLKVSYPPQEVLAHIRNRQSGDGADGEGQKFKPWHELYHPVRRAFYQDIPPAERERIHGLLQDFYMRERGHEPEARVMNIKGRALLAEAKFHSSAARGRKPVRGEIVKASAEGSEDWIDSKAYLYRNVKPLAAQSRFTLEDYRTLRLPDEAEGSLDEPFPPELAAESEAGAELESMSFQQALANLELTDEERGLLYEKEPLALPSKSPTPMRSFQPPPEPEDMPKAGGPVPMDPPVDANKAAAPDLNTLTDGLMAAPHAADAREKAIQQRLAAAVASRDKPAMARELVALARYRAGMGRYGSAGQCLEKALSLKADVNRSVQAEIYRLSGAVNKETYHHNAAMAALSKAAVLIKKLMYEDDTVDAVWMGRLGQVYQDMGEIHAYRRRHAEAMEAFQQALRWYNSADDTLRQAEVYVQTAELHDERGDLENAVGDYEKALALDEANGNRPAAAATLASLGSLHFEAGRTADALECLERSLAYDRDGGNVEGQLNTLETLAVIFTQGGDWRRAEKACRQGLSLALQESLSVWKATFYLKLGQLAQRQNNAPEALKYFESARSSGEAELSDESLARIEAQIREVRQALG